LLRVVAQNTVGDTWDYADPNLNEIVVGGFPTVTTEAISEVITIGEPPAAPSDLTATLDAGPQISLAWTDNATTETGYVVQRSTDGVNFTDLATLGIDAASYVDMAVSAGNTYTYQVAAFNGSGRSDYAVSNSVSVATPAPPSNLAAVLNGAQIDLAWSDNSLDETGFVIQRSTDGVNFTDLATVGAEVVAYADLAVSAGNTYYYRVAAFNLAGASAYSNTASVLIPGITPVAPSDLSATLEDVPLIHLQWADNSADETSFVIELSTDGVNFTLLATVPADTITYNDFAVLGGFTYTYRVAAVNTNGSSGFAVSNSVLVPPDATPPAAPSNLSASNVQQTTLTLSWMDNSNNETGFTIQRATDSAFTKNVVNINVGPNVTSYNDSGLTRKTKYFYRVLAFNGFNGGAGPFPWSPTLNVTTKK
jgi:titin